MLSAKTPTKDTICSTSNKLKNLSLIFVPIFSTGNDPLIFKIISYNAFKRPCTDDNCVKLQVKSTEAKAN